jgi:rhombotail lipoprotein
MRSRPVAILLAAVALAGCVSQQVNQRSNVVEYPYAGGAEGRPATTVRLVRPVRVGIGFAPSAGTAKDSFSAAQKQALLEDIATRFRDRPGIEAIEIIPDTALTPRGGFAELDRIRAGFRVGQIVLVSYDQVQFTNTGPLALTYWVTYGAGAYVIKGEKN